MLVKQTAGGGAWPAPGLQGGGRGSHPGALNRDEGLNWAAGRPRSLGFISRGKEGPGATAKAELASARGTRTMAKNVLVW